MKQRKVRFNYDLLEQRLLTANTETYERLLECTGLSDKEFKRILLNQDYLSLDEIVAIGEVLEIPSQDYTQYFFNAIY